MEQIPDIVRRFLLTSIPSVPHLELLMLLWRDKRKFSVEEIASRLYLGQEAARTLVEDLHGGELLVRTEGPESYAVRTDAEELTALLHAVDRTYSRHVRAVSELVHGNVERKALNFVKAFEWRKR